MTFTKQFRLKSESLVMKRSDNELILVKLVDNIIDMTKVLVLNETAAFIVENIDGQRTLDDISQLLDENFEIDAETIKSDLLDFISKALENDLIE